LNANEVVLSVVAALDHFHIPYMLVGSYSSNFYGVARATQDADLVAQLEGSRVSEIASRLGAEFQLDPQLSFEAITSTTRYNIIHLPSSFRIELFLLSDDPHDRRRFARRVQATIAGHSVFVPTVEDVIITKLRWSKGGNRTKDVEDVENILLVQAGRLDVPYIRHWTDQHSTRDLFERLLAAAE
jgi:hypothetical protein